MPESEHPAVAINRSLHRLPLILDILEEIENGDRHLCDDDLKQGSYQALRRMIESLKRIKPPKAIEKDAPPTTEVEIATSWLLGERPKKLLPLSVYEDLSELIEKLVPRSAEVMHGQNKALS